MFSSVLCWDLHFVGLLEQSKVIFCFEWNRKAFEGKFEGTENVVPIFLYV